MKKKLYALTDDQAEELINMLTKDINTYQKDEIWGPSMVGRLSAIKHSLENDQAVDQNQTTNTEN